LLGQEIGFPFFDEWNFPSFNNPLQILMAPLVRYKELFIVLDYTPSFTIFTATISRQK
jgi:hypothetical protein